jgi:hypothetical protein
MPDLIAQSWITRCRRMPGDRVHIVEKGQTVWVLLIILLTAVPGVSQGIVQGAVLLNMFSTQEACQQERNRIGFEMAEAYPGENDFLIACRFREWDPKVQARLQSREGNRVIGGSLAGRQASVRGESLASKGSVPGDRASLTPAPTSDPTSTSRL